MKLDFSKNKKSHSAIIISLFFFFSEIKSDKPSTKAASLLCIKHKLQDKSFWREGQSVFFMLSKIKYFLIALPLFILRTKTFSCNCKSLYVYVRIYECVKNYFEIDAHAGKFQPKHFKYCKVNSK